MGRLSRPPTFVKAIQERDFVYLTSLIKDASLSDEDRRDLADTILALVTTKRPAHRPAKASTKEKGFEVAWRVFALRQSGWDKKGAAVRKAAEEFRCKDRKVYHYLKQLNEYVRREEDYEDRLWRHHVDGRFTDEEMELARDRYEDWLEQNVNDPEPTDEEVEAAGEAYLSWLSDFVRGK